MNKLTILVLSCGLLCACTKDETGEVSAPQTVRRSISVAAAAPASRTQLAADGYNVLWSPGDRIGVFVRSGDTFTTFNAPLTFEGAEAASSGVFSGEITLTEGESLYTLYAYYPWSEQPSADATAVAFTLPARQAQVAAGDSSHLGAYDFLVAEVAQSTSGVFEPLTFRHAFAVVEADLTGSGAMAGKSVASVMLFGTDAATVKGTGTGTLTDMANMAGSFTFDLTAARANNTANYAGGSAQINYCGVDLATPPVLGTTPSKIYCTINPADYSAGNGTMYVVVRTTDGYTTTFTRPGLAVAAGQMKVIRQQITEGTAPGPAVDLSGAEPANCYVASEPCREYTFDATVAGNGVVTPGLQAAVQRYEGRTLQTTLAGGDVRLLWQSNPYLIDASSLRCEAGRIRFTLTERPTVLGGDAVLALYPDAASDEAVWSWHIWITDKTDEELLALAETYVMYAPYEQAYGAGAVQMMDRNLGAVYKEDGPYARSFRAPLYQWGRKDPFPWGTIVFDARNVPHSYILEYKPVQTSGALGQYAGYTGNTWYATAHPDTFIATTGASSYDWYYGAGRGVTPDFRNNELWGNPTGFTVGQTTTKTLFDPCPPGWKVPMPFVFSGFTKTGADAAVDSGEVNVSGKFLQGWNMIYAGANTTYYPGVGYRYDEAGVFLFSQTGYYWSSAPWNDSAFGAWAFLLSETRIYTRFATPRGSGYAVRCQKE